MSDLTDTSSSEAVPTPQSGEPPTANDHGAYNNSAFAVANPYLARWLHAIASDGVLPSEALTVANAMARSAGIGRVSFTDWQRINAALGRDRRDLTVLEIMSELVLKGYIDRTIPDRLGRRKYGWTLLIPKGEL